ncbi:MAG: DRTGG domain-containing protein [Smithella sp.]
MKLRYIKHILDSEVIVGDDRLDIEITTACGADLMSDVLSFAKAGSLLLTGLANAQVIRTASILDLAAIILVRGKKPSSETISLAREHKIPLLTTQYTLFETAGRLYIKGLISCLPKVETTKE